MALKTLVKVGRISNLSDARYCAGMGVDYLGFRVVKGDPYFVDEKQFQEMRGWFAGPKVIAELYGIQSDEDVKNAVEKYAPDLLEVSMNELQYISHSNQNIIVSISTEKPNEITEVLKDFADRVEFLILPSKSNHEHLKQVSEQFDVLLSVDEEVIDIHEVASNPAVKGVVLSGSEEEKPGLKSYIGLADILEQLEVED